MNKHPVDVLLSFLIQADSPGPLTQYLYAVCLKVKWLFGKQNKTLGLWWPPVVKQPILLFPVGKTKQVERVRMEKIWARERRYSIWECLGCPLKLCGKNEAEGSLTGCKRSGIFQLALVMLLAAISDAHSGAKRLENTSNVQETNMRLRQGQVLL